MNSDLPAPFMIITPLGQLMLSDLLAETNNAGIRIRRLHWLAHWSQRATGIYVKQRADDFALMRAIAYEDAWQNYFPSNRAILCELKSLGDYHRLAGQKRRLRTQFPTLRLCFEFSGHALKLRLHAFHVPDKEDWLSEARILNATNG